MPTTPAAFSLSSHGEEVYLFSADGAGNLTGYSEGFSFSDAESNVSFGRYTITGNHIDYVDDTGFTADGDFVDGVLHHGGMIFRRE